MRCQLPEKTCLAISKPSAYRAYTQEPASSSAEHLDSGSLLAVERCRSAGVGEWGSAKEGARAPDEERREQSEEKILRSYLTIVAKPHVTASLYHPGICMYRFDIY